MKSSLPSFIALALAVSAVSAFAEDGIGVIRPKSNAPVVPLWLNGAPGFESRRDEPEKIINNRQTNVHYPTLTVFLPPAALATGTAILIVPGGGHGHLAIEHEGYNVAEWLAARGVASFVVKYRLSRDEAAGGKTPYTIDVHELGDVQRALRLIRSRAAEWGVDPARLGIMGFSAGGELAVLAATRPDAGKPGAADLIERQNSRTAFVALMYPGGVSRPDVVVTKELPPVFLGCGGEERTSEAAANFFLACRKAGVSAELHIYAGIGHGFGLQESVKTDARFWPEHFYQWLVDRKLAGEPKPQPHPQG